MHRSRSLPIAHVATILLAACGGTSSSPGTPPAVTPAALQAFPACDRAFEITAPNPKNVWTPNAVVLVSKELAPGVFAVYDQRADDLGPKGVPLATSGGFVIGANEVLLVETMINRPLFCQLITLVRAQTSKPITYAVNTSYHGDHSYGNAFLPPEVKIVQHERTAAYIAAHFAADVDFMKANFGADQGLDEIRAVPPAIPVGDAGWSVDLGDVTVRADYHGFGQTPGDLFVSVPSAKVVWTGNPLIAERPAIPWLLDGRAHDVAVTLAAVKRAVPAGGIVVPGHGRPVGADAFDFSLAYLAELTSNVEAAVGAKWTSEQAIERVTLDKFQGYAIWDFVHRSVNVPKTYAELSH